ncbi:MAG: AEC family transporter [Salinarimonadaceae bacterium]|nr:MAG: AEC family transporter [Salinarimonadaceae bacterium]
MLASAAIVFPVFGLIALGYGARFFRVLDDQMGESLSRFVFTMAIPSLLFATIARSEIPEVDPWAYLGVYFFALAVVWLVADQVSRRIAGDGHAGAVVTGFSAAQSNLVLVGVPLIISAYGPAAAAPLFLLVGVHLPVTLTTATLLLEGREASFVRILGKLARHPIILALLAGSAMRLSGLDLPAPLWRLLEILGGAAVPGALVATGVALFRYGLEAGWRMPALVAVLKLMVQPAIVYVLVFHVVTLPPVWAATAVLLAACPTGVNAYLLAQSYREGVALASGCVFLTTVLAMFSTAVWIAIIGVPAP